MLLLAAVLAMGCAGMVTSAEPDRVVIEHDPLIPDDSVLEVASKACGQMGRRVGERLSRVQKNPALPAGFSMLLSTYRCHP